MRLLFTALALCTLGCAQPARPQNPPLEQKTADLAGTWTWKQGAESLDLTLKQDGTAIIGYHSAVGQRGAKVDEVVADAPEPSIRGEVKGSVATVQFRTGYPDATGHGTATLTFKNGALTWQIVKSEGEHYLPKAARLTRAAKQ